jgi:hypothetical protein
MPNEDGANVWLIFILLGEATAVRLDGRGQSLIEPWDTSKEGQHDRCIRHISL